ncbi:PadR family transcriptional regulator [Actinoallomurus sp. NPDC052274]|uniref:PadR family transcriptional regulator n=1 Tax=Actinoallomurus sp. NPDC052274 TaxID=3155420 RepID=UPI00342FFCC2
MAKRKVSNPLALAVLAVLSERSMHPYEMATTLKARGKERSIRMNYGSLYTVVDALVRAGFITPVETVREGRRPERTIYALTASGETELGDWLRDILRNPRKEFPEFEAGLSLLPVLPPDEAVAALKERRLLLEDRAAELDGLVEKLLENGLRRLFCVEADYESAMLRAELGWVRALIKEIEDGSLEDLPDWRRWHEQPTTKEDKVL